MHREHHTLIAELLPAPMFDDPSLGHPYQQYDPATGRTTRSSVILAEQQPAGIPLTWSHDAADVDPAGTERAGTLHYLERDGRGAIWGLFAVPTDLAFFGLGGKRHVSIGFTGKALHLLDKLRPAADPTMTPGTAAYLRGGQAVRAVMDHVALTNTPAAATKEVTIVPVDFTAGAGNLGYPYDHERHRAIIERAARHLDERARARRSHGAAVDHVDIVGWAYAPKPPAVDVDDDGDIVGWRNGKVIRTGDDVARHPAASPVGMRNGVPTIRRYFPDAKLTIR